MAFCKAQADIHCYVLTYSDFCVKGTLILDIETLSSPVVFNPHLTIIWGMQGFIDLTVNSRLSFAYSPRGSCP